MVEIFRCARAEVYHNSGKKTLTQVKKETGCTHIINGYLFNSSFRPLGWTVIDGKIISRDAYRDWGVSIGADRRPVMILIVVVFPAPFCPMMAVGRWSSSRSSALMTGRSLA